MELAFRGLFQVGPLVAMAGIGGTILIYFVFPPALEPGRWRAAG